MLDLPVIRNGYVASYSWGKQLFSYILEKLKNNFVMDNHHKTLVRILLSS